MDHLMYVTAPLSHVVYHSCPFHMSYVTAAFVTCRVSQLPLSHVICHSSLVTYRVGFREWRKFHDNFKYVTQVGFLQHVWESTAGQRLFPWQLSICLQHGEETRAHSSGEAT